MSQVRNFKRSHRQQKLLSRAHCFLEIWNQLAAPAATWSRYSTLSFSALRSPHTDYTAPSCLLFHYPHSLVASENFVPYNFEKLLAFPSGQQIFSLPSFPPMSTQASSTSPDALKPQSRYTQRPPWVTTNSIPSCFSPRIPGPNPCNTTS